jgi:hypothetical protein
LRPELATSGDSDIASSPDRRSSRPVKRLDIRLDESLIVVRLHVSGLRARNRSLTEEVHMSRDAKSIRSESQGAKPAPDNQKKGVRDLDVSRNDAEQVKAGRRLNEDPCTGGE